MRKLLVLLAGVALATQALAVVPSTVTFTLTPDNPDLSIWTFIVGIGDGATDDYDSGLDANEPPWPPGPEVRMHTLGVPGSSGGLMMDFRDGLVDIDITPYWSPVDPSVPVRGEVWGLGAVDPAFPDICTIDGSELGLTGYTTGTLTWDLAEAGPYRYFLFDLDAGVEMEMLPGGQYDWMVMNRYGIGPTLIVSAVIIPEPGTLMLVGTGLLALAGLARRR